LEAENLLLTQRLSDLSARLNETTEKSQHAQEEMDNLYNFIESYQRGHRPTANEGQLRCPRCGRDDFVHADHISVHNHSGYCVSAQDLKVLFVRVKYYRTPAQHIKLLARFDKAYEYSTIYNVDEDRDPGRWLDWHNMKADDFAAIPWLHSLGSHPYLRPLMYQLQNFFGNLYPPAFGPNVTIAAARTTVAATTVPDNVARLPKRRRHAVVPANAAPAEQRKAPIRRSVRCQHIHYIYLQATIAGRSAFLLSNMRHSKTS
jgi:hypothetical protein